MPMSGLGPDWSKTSVITGPGGSKTSVITVPDSVVTGIDGSQLRYIWHWWVPDCIVSARTGVYWVIISARPGVYW